MSLRAIHLVFILASMVLADMFGAWSLRQHVLADQPWTLWIGVVSLAVGLALALYAFLFVRKMDQAGVQ